MIKAAVCGGSGYVGGELLRLLENHPKVRVTAVTSEKSAGKKIIQLFPSLTQYSAVRFEPLAKDSLLGRADVFFLALPHSTSQGPTDFFFRAGKKVIDLSADYRLRDPKVYEKWYAVPHEHKGTLKAAVFGLPEIYRKKIAKAALVANPGCYPTGAILGLYPLLKQGRASLKGIVIDSKSGVSGAGRHSATQFSYCEVNEGFKAYAIATHRHTPEIEQELSALAGRKVHVDFTPHLAPFKRGILSTIYVRVKDLSGIHRLYKNTYAREPFVRVLEEGEFPNVNTVQGTNRCDIGVAVNKKTGTAIVVTALDNLVKGAAGQAIQNMNLMHGLPEAMGLGQQAVFP